MKTKTIIIFRKQGQMANNMVLFAHVIAFAKAHNYKVIHLAFFDYRQFFIQTQNRIFATFPNNKIKFYCPPILNKLLYLFLIKFQKYILNLDTKIIKTIISNNEEALSFFEENNISNLKNSIIVLDGWMIRDYTNLAKYKNEIKSYFNIKLSHQKNIEKFMQSLKAYTCVAVHIRRGDYKTFLDGIYFYNLEVYKSYMFQIFNILNVPNLKFIIFSNEKIDIEFFTPLSATNGPGNAIEDLYCMAKCDYIIGPPSTFSIWASFYGNKPLYHITDPTKHLSISEFSISNC